MLIQAQILPQRGPDRRRRPTPAISRYLFRGRRRSNRRADSLEDYYVDVAVPDARLAVLLLGALSIMDAFLSLRLFAKGLARELNPLLVLALQHGNQAFFLVKLLLTALATFVVLLHWNFVVFRKVTVTYLAYVLIGLYTALLLYEALLLVFG